MFRPSPQQQGNQNANKRAPLPAKARLPSQSPHSIHPTKEGTIANLSSQEKEKVSRLVQRLVSLGQEHELALAALKEEKDAFSDGTLRLQHMMEDQVAVISDKLRSKDNEINELEAKNSLSAGLLALYQTKLKNSADMFRFYELSTSDSKIKVHQLESDLLSLQALVASQKHAIESFEVSRVRHSATVQQLRDQEEAAALRHRSELRSMETAVAERDARIAELQREVERLRAARASEAASTRSVVQGTGADRVLSNHPSTHNLDQQSTPHSFSGRSVLDSSRSESAPAAPATTPSPAAVARTASAAAAPEQTRRPAVIGASENETDYAMYGPMYSSIDTSAISFSSSHHHTADAAHVGGTSRHDLSVLTEPDTATATAVRRRMGEEEQGEDPARVMSYAHRYDEHSLPNESDWRASVAAHTALDPTPMKRRTKHAGVVAGAEDNSPSGVIRLQSTSSVAGTSRQVGTNASSPAPTRPASTHTHQQPAGVEDVKVEDSGADSSPPLRVSRVKAQARGASSSTALAASADKKKPKKSGKVLKSRLSEEHNATSEASRRVKSAEKSSGRLSKEQSASSAAAQRHRTFDASDPNTFTTATSLLRASTSEAHDARKKPPASALRAVSVVESVSRPKSESKPASASSAARTRDRTVVYDDSLFNLLSEMELSYP